VSAPVAGGFDFSTSDDGALVDFWGIIDVAVRDGGTADLWEARRVPGRLTVDCRRATKMDSIGLSILVRLVRDAVGDGQQVCFLGATGQVADLLATAGVEAWMRDLGVTFTT